MATVTIEIESKWVKIVRSPLFWIVGMLQGVAFTFAPAFLYLSGKEGFLFHGYEWLVAPFCFASIVIVGWFYLLLSRGIMVQLCALTKTKL
jgi:hypothetical protein